MRIQSEEGARIDRIFVQVSTFYMYLVGKGEIIGHRIHGGNFPTQSTGKKRMRSRILVK